VNRGARLAIRRARGPLNRVLQIAALYAPGAESTRVWIHRARGVKIGDGVFIGTDAIIETSKPHLVSIGDGAAIGIRSTIIAHFRGRTKADAGGVDTPSVLIGKDAFIGPGVIILPNVTIGEGAVVTAGSVVTRSVAPLTMVQGNPARPIARCGVALGMKTDLAEFYRRLKPL
jgi:acetyltransferase-like isoleucine patch superfamily enzyme